VNRFIQLSALAGVLFSSAGLRSSDPVGIYAIVDKVVFEPNESAPERIQIWGAFSLSTGPGMGDTYHAPAQGYLYYSADAVNAEITAKEWSDLKTLAGTDACIGLASRYSPMGTVRGGCDAAAKPDVYPISALGLQKLRTNTDYQPIQDLLAMPGPRSPENGSTSVEPGSVTLAARNILTDQHAGARYVFQLINDYGEILQSPEIDPGKTTTQWTPSVPVDAGRTYTWNVHAVDGAWSGPTATACFQLPFLRGDVNGDREIDISDPVSLLFFLFTGGTAPKPRVAADADGSGKLEITDAVYLLMYLFQGGSPPPPPFPEPGLLPTGP
jgi:hypothetical protein